MFPFVLKRLKSFIDIHDFLKTLKSLTSNPIYSFDASRNLITPPKYSWKRLTDVSNKSVIKVGINDILNSVTLKGAGEVFDMENLEFLGDSFLKYSMTLALFCNKTVTKGDEGFLTQFRSRLVGNKRLFLYATIFGIQKLISGIKFEPHLNWRPPRFSNDQDLEKRIVDWDDEFRIKVREYDNEDNLDEDLEKKKLAQSKKTVFQMMTEEDWLAHPTNKKEFLKTMKRRLQNESDPKLVQDKKLRQMSPINHSLLNDKSIADVIEALIGIHLANGGQKEAAKFMGVLGLGFEADEQILDVIRLEQRPVNQTWFDKIFENLPQTGLWIIRDTGAFNPHVDRRDVDESLDTFCRKVNVVQIQSQLGYTFKDKSFLIEALTHASYSLNKITDSYERLEFLGDAILDYMITCHLTCNHPGLSPGELTNLRSALVNNNTLASIAVKNRLHTHLLQQSPELFRRISAYVNELELAMDEDNIDQDQHNMELYNEEECPVFEQIEIPKALGDIVESLIGAIFLDCKYDLEVVWKVIKELFDDDLYEIVRKKPKNFTARLMELFPERVIFKKPELQKDGKIARTVLVFRSLTDDKPMHFRGLGLNKISAKMAASKCALRELKKRKIINDM